MFCDSISRLAACGVVVVGAGVASAGTLYDTLGPSDASDGLSYWSVGTTNGRDVWQAMPFDVGAGEYSDIEISVAMSWTNTLAPELLDFSLVLYAADGTGPTPGGPVVSGAPGTRLAELNLDATSLPEWDGDNGPVPTTFSFDTTLAGNMRYWLAVETERPSDGQILWHLNTMGVSIEKAQRVETNGAFPSTWTILQGDLWGNDGAMRVSGTLVPAPGCVAVLGAGGLALVRRRRRA